MVQKILHNDILLSIIIRANYKSNGIEFFTPDDYSQQLAYMNRPKNYVIPPHVHNIARREVLFTKEVLVIRSGVVRVDFYDDDMKYLKSTILNTGDIILLAFGGHGFEMIEESEIIEIKQGPYVGEFDKTRFDAVSKENLNFEL
jgi:hypothetical protein